MAVVSSEASTQTLQECVYMCKKSNLVIACVELTQADSCAVLLPCFQDYICASFLLTGIVLGRPVVQTLMRLAPQWTTICLKQLIHSNQCQNC